MSARAMPLLKSQVNEVIDKLKDAKKRGEAKNIEKALAELNALKTRN